MTLSVAVLSVENRLYLCCRSDDNSTPIIFEADQFITVNDKIPSNWVVSLDELGNMNIAPRKWLRPSFWEDYFNFDSLAISDFESEMETIIAESYKWGLKGA